MGTTRSPRPIPATTERRAANAGVNEEGPGPPAGGPGPSCLPRAGADGPPQAQTSAKKYRPSTCRRSSYSSGSISQSAPATELNSELPSWGVKQKP